VITVMYEQHWNLACRPFESYFSPAFFYDSDTHQAARLKLRYLVENRLGTGVLCGGIGTGKTAVAAFLQHELGEACGPVAHLVFPKMPAAALLAYVASKLGAPETAADSRQGIDRTLTRIEARLRESSQHGQHPVIIVDESHLIDDVRIFECLQLLLNFQLDAACSFSLVLVGGTSLFGRLERMPQLNDRIAVRSVLEPLSLDDTIGYVAHRLHAAEAKGKIFDDDAVAELHARSGGIPRRINRLADLALVVGYADQLETIGAAEIEAVADEIPPAIAA
jgi:type II secretory pathway predicted ATPase ExeA